MNAVKTIAFMGLMHGVLTAYLPLLVGSTDPARVDPGYARYPAPLLWFVGAAVIVWCSAELVRRGNGTPVHFDPPKVMVVTGLYRYVRNPIYVGALCVILGSALWFGSPLLIVYVLFAWLVFHALIVLVEEPILRSTFGAAFEDYRRRVPRWIPNRRGG